MKNFVRSVFLILLCLNLAGHSFAQTEASPIELNTPISFEVTSSEAPGSEFFFSYEGAAGEHLVIYIVPSTISLNDVRGTLEVRRSDGTALNRNFSIHETIWYLPADDTYTIYVASTTPDTFEISISNPVELGIGEIYEGEFNSLLDQFYIVRSEEQLGLRMQYNDVEGSPNLQTVRLSGRYMGYPETYLAFGPAKFESIELLLEEYETPLYLIELILGGSLQEEYEASTFTLEAFTPES